MRIICHNCGESYSDRFETCPVCGEPQRDVLEELIEAETAKVPPTLPELDVKNEPEQKQAPVRRKGDTDTGPIHSFAFGEEDEDDATVRKPLRPTPQPRQYYHDAEENSDQSYAPRYAKPKKRNDRIPVWMVVTISVALSLALIVGALTLVYAMGVFDQPEDPSIGQSQTPGEELEIADPSDTSNDTPDITPADDTHTTVGNITVVDDPAEEFPIENVTTDGEPETPVVECSSLSLDTVDFTLAFRGDNHTMTATTEPAEAAEFVTWESSDPIVATVDENGRVEAMSKGTVTITATCGEQTAKCIVRCEQLPPASSMLFLSAEDITMNNAGESVTLRITDELSDEELKGLTWTSSKPEVAKVDENGVVTALTGGTATITAQTGDRIGTCLVRCGFSGDGSYKISHSDVTMSYIGEYFNLYITHDGVKMTEVTWFTSDSNVVTVNDMGVVTAMGDGTATITTVVDGNSLQCVVRVRTE